MHEAYTAALSLTSDRKVDVLSEIAYELLSDLLHDGRMTAAEELDWRVRVDAVVMDRPDWIAPGGTAIYVAEERARSAALKI